MWLFLAVYNDCRLRYEYYTFRFACLLIFENKYSQVKYLIALLPRRKRPVIASQVGWTRGSEGSPWCSSWYKWQSFLSQKPKGEVIAIGLQPANDNGMLTFASNEDTVPEATLKHAPETLSMLQELGKWFASMEQSVKWERNKENNEEPTISDESLFPESLREELHLALPSMRFHSRSSARD